jgi:glycosyltransferase involved in cell wall biosynthesis
LTAEKRIRTVSVIITTYNYAQFITSAVESVIGQGFGGNVEIIVVDDGSIDNTYACLTEYVNRGAIKYFYQGNRGKASATKKAIEASTGEIIFNLDADDWFLPGKIQKTVNIFERYPEVVHVASPAKMVKKNHESVIEKIPQKWLDKPVDGMLLLNSFFTEKVFFGSSSSFAARSSSLKSMVWEDKVDMYTDVWLLMEVLKNGKTYFVSEALNVWREHGNNYSLSGVNKQIKYDRLESSSAAILELLTRLHYPKQLYNSYKLQHIIWQLMHKEDLRKKSLLDICHFLCSEVVSMKHKLRTLWNYNAHVRIIPQSLLNILKRKSL